MKISSQSSLFNQFKVFLVALALVIGVQYVSAAWTDPSATAPGNNTDTPLNVGDSLQQKLGSLVLNSDTSNPYQTGLTVFGNSDFNGHVQIADGSQGAGKVLVSDANGNASWGSASASSSDASSGGAFHYISPVTIYTHTVDGSQQSMGMIVNDYGPLPWTTYKNTSSVIPSNATEVILQEESALNGPDDTSKMSQILIRANASSPQYFLGAGMAAGGNDQVAAANQGIFPAGPGGTFQYSIVTGYDLGVSIQIIGYIE